MEGSDHLIVEIAERLSRTFPVYQEREDVKQEICLALLRAKERFNPKKGNWETFAKTTGEWVVTSYFRDRPFDGTHWRRYTNENVYFNELDEISQNKLSTEFKIPISLLLKPFRERDKKVALCLIMGYSKTEVASMLNISGAVISRILKRLQLENLRYSAYVPTD